MRIGELLRRHFWIVLANLVAVAAFLHAHALDALVASRPSPDAAALAERPASAGERGHASPLPVSRDLRAAIVATRNVFDSVTGPLREEAEATLSVSGAAKIEDPMDAPQCDGVKVVAIAASADPDWSLASFVPSEAASPVLRRRGGGVAGRTVSFIGWDRVWLIDAKGLCQAAMWTPPKPEAPGGDVHAEKASPGDALKKQVAGGIRRLGPTAFKIDRGVVDQILEHQAALFSGAQVVPDATSGKGGFRVSGLKPDSLLTTLGIQNGDRLEAINGLELTDPEKALEAYARLRNWQHLLLTVNRNGVETNLDYDIEP